MTGTYFFQRLSPEHLRENMAAYIAISADVSSWTAENFLADRPRKWELSFAIWDDTPIAYCVLSVRNGEIHINQFMVAPEYRGEGVGTLMLTEARRRGATTLKVGLENEAAIRFYRTHGFANDGCDNGYVVMKADTLIKPMP